MVVSFLASGWTFFESLNLLTQLIANSDLGDLCLLSLLRVKSFFLLKLTIIMLYEQEVQETIANCKGT